MNKTEYKESQFIESQRRNKLLQERVDNLTRKIDAQEHTIQLQREELRKQEIFIVQIRKELIARL